MIDPNSPELIEARRQAQLMQGMSYLAANVLHFGPGIDPQSLSGQHESVRQQLGYAEGAEPVQFYGGYTEQKFYEPGKHNYTQVEHLRGLAATIFQAPPETGETSLRTTLVEQIIDVAHEGLEETDGTFMNLPDTSMSTHKARSAVRHELDGLLTRTSYNGNTLRWLQLKGISSSLRESWHPVAIKAAGAAVGVVAVARFLAWRAKQR